MKVFALIIAMLLALLCHAQMTNNSLPKAEVTTTSQRVTLNGKAFYLTTKGGTFKIKDKSNKPIALMGFIYYTRDSYRG